MRESHQEFYELAERRGKVYAFLSSFYLQKLNQNSIEKLKEAYKLVSSLVSSMPESISSRDLKEGLDIIKGFLSHLKDKLMEEIRENLAVAHTRLFKGVAPHYSPPPPYESVYKEGRVMGRSTLDVMEEYRKAHAGVLEAYRKEIPDSIGIELNFMYFLCSKEAQAWKDGDRSKALSYLRREMEFIRNHLRWLSQFHDAAKRFCKEMETNFYLGVIKLTIGFVDLDYGLINTLIHEV